MYEISTKDAISERFLMHIMTGLIGYKMKIWDFQPLEWL